MNRRKKITSSILLLLLLAAGVIVCVLRWNAWFGNLPEEAYEVPSMPHNFMLTYGDRADSRLTLSWRADTILRPSFAILTKDNTGFDTISAKGEMVSSRAGKAAYYSVRLTNLTPSDYTVMFKSGQEVSEPYHFSVADMADSLSFVILGDIQDLDGQWSKQLFAFVNEHYPATPIMQVGDLIERPMDSYWQLFFSTYESERLHPFIAATGNHEYLKGVVKHLDSRWTHIFRNPHNGYSRALGTSYFLDFPLCRVIVLDTDGLWRLSDYTRAATWLTRALQEAGDRHKIVMMHHPVYAAGMGRDNPIIKITFQHLLRQADLVIAGHDHSYARRIVRQPINKHDDYVSVITSTSKKEYLSKVNDDDDRLCSGHPMLCHLSMDSTKMVFSAFVLKEDSNNLQEQLYDQVIIYPDTVIDHYSHSEEILDLPERYKGKDSRKVRSFNERVSKRQLMP